MVWILPASSPSSGGSVTPPGIRTQGKSCWAARAIIMAGSPLSQVATPRTPLRVGSERINRRRTRAAAFVRTSRTAGSDSSRSAIIEAVVGGMVGLIGRVRAVGEGAPGIGFEAGAGQTDEIVEGAVVRKGTTRHDEGAARGAINVA